jgi:hypothetical protein
MNKRRFLQAGATIVGTAWLSHYLIGRSEVMAISNNEFEVKKTEEEWRTILTPEQYKVLRQHGTERAHTSPLDKEYDKVLIYVQHVICHFLHQTPNLIVAQVGPVFSNQLKVRSPSP